VSDSVNITYSFTDTNYSTGDVRVEVYGIAAGSATSTLVKTLEDAKAVDGGATRTVTWDGTDGNGGIVPSGAYTIFDYSNRSEG